jgi:hypothetical protein
VNTYVPGAQVGYKAFLETFGVGVFAWGGSEAETRKYVEEFVSLYYNIAFAVSRSSGGFFDYLT